jgi:hypothetical protein
MFATLHPCFNNPSTVQMAELQDREGVIVTTYSVKVSRYSTPYTQVGSAMHRQPVPHPYFHRPLGVLLQDMFDGIRARRARRTRFVSREHWRKHSVVLERKVQ